jgi:hypothetical protein
MIMFDINNTIELRNMYTFDTSLLWDRFEFCEISTCVTIVIEKGYISQKNKGVTAEHILLCGKCIGGLIAKGYNVIEADPLKWIPDMLSTGNVVPNNAQIKKMSKMLVDQMEPGRRMNEHHRAAYLMGQWAYKQLKLGLI